MNLKIVNFFTVFLITLIVLSPSLILFSIVWEKHLEFVQAQQNISTYHTSITSECSALSLEINSLRNSDYLNLSLNSIKTNLKVSDKYQIIHLWRWIFLVLPFCIILIIVLYDRYLVYRANIFQQQVEMLEKIWRQSVEN